MTWNPWKLQKMIGQLLAERAELQLEVESSHRALVMHILKALELRRTIDEADAEFLHQVGAKQ